MKSTVTQQYSIKLHKSQQPNFDEAKAWIIATLKTKWTQLKEYQQTMTINNKPADSHVYIFQGSTTHKKQPLCKINFIKSTVGYNACIAIQIYKDFNQETQELLEDPSFVGVYQMIPLTKDGYVNLQLQLSDAHFTLNIVQPSNKNSAFFVYCGFFYPMFDMSFWEYPLILTGNCTRCSYTSYFDVDNYINSSMILDSSDRYAFFIVDQVFQNYFIDSQGTIYDKDGVRQILNTKGFGVINLRDHPTVTTFIPYTAYYDPYSKIQTAGTPLDGKLFNIDVMIYNAPNDNAGFNGYGVGILRGMVMPLSRVQTNDECVDSVKNIKYTYTTLDKKFSAIGLEDETA